MGRERWRRAPASLGILRSTAQRESDQTASRTCSRFSSRPHRSAHQAIAGPSAAVVCAQRLVPSAALRIKERDVGRFPMSGMPSLHSVRHARGERCWSTAAAIAQSTLSSTTHRKPWNGPLLPDGSRTERTLDRRDSPACDAQRRPNNASSKVGRIAPVAFATFVPIRRVGETRDYRAAPDCGKSTAWNRFVIRVGGIDGLVAGDMS